MKLHCMHSRSTLPDRGACYILKCDYLTIVCWLVGISSKMYNENKTRHCESAFAMCVYMYTHSRTHTHIHDTCIYISKEAFIALRTMYWRRHIRRLVYYLLQQ